MRSRILNPSLSSLAGAGVVGLAFAAPCSAFEFRTRFVERIGNTDVVLTNNTIDASDGAARQIRIQFGVFDDVNGPAPAGGFAGWNAGTISVSGAADNSDETRTPGRIAPWNFSVNPNANGSPVLPGGDPFTMLTQIDATLGTQTLVWGCDANDQPLPAPAPIVRGLNSFVSIYQITIDPRPGASSYALTCGGFLVGVQEWRTIGTPIPPDCMNDQPGTILYGPFALAPQSFSSTLSVVVPGPGAGVAALFGFGALAARRRHR